MTEFGRIGDSPDAVDPASWPAVTNAIFRRFLTDEVIRVIHYKVGRTEQRYSDEE